MTMTQETAPARPLAVVFTARSNRVRKGDVLTEQVANSEHPVREFVVDRSERSTVYYEPEHAYLPAWLLVGRDLRNGQTVQHLTLSRRRWLVRRPVAEALR